MKMMNKMYNHISTDYDMMKEFLIQGCELSEHGFPVLQSCTVVPKMFRDFTELKKIKAKDFRQTAIHFYTSDDRFERVWNMPHFFTDQFKNLKAICGMGYTLDQYAPLPLQMWNKYRNHALDYFYASNGVTVIPHVNILSARLSPFIFEGIPKESVISCTTNGRIKTKEKRLDFCNSFNEMLWQLEPKHVIIIGREVDELNADVPISFHRSFMQERYDNGELG